MRKVALLGANGQLGTEITRIFGGSSVEVTRLTRREFNADLDSPFEKLTAIADHDFLINCIAYHKVDLCEENVSQSFKINSEFVLSLSRFCAEHGITLIHISTDYVFDGFKRESYLETDIPSPLNVYGTSKLAGEGFVRAYASKYYILRTSSLFGGNTGDDPNANFVEKMVHAAKAGKALRVINDQIMSPTHAAEVARAIRSLIENDVDEYGIYHCCNDGRCSWFEFAGKIFELIGLSADLAPVPYNEFHTKARRPQFCSMDNSKISKYYAMKPWEQALEDYLNARGYR